jgi:protein-S-isoprenylcysteine O-methyltransferase Ste14
MIAPLVFKPAGVVRRQADGAYKPQTDSLKSWGMSMDQTTPVPAIVRIPPPVWTLAMLLIAYGVQRSFAWAAVVYLRSEAAAVVLIVAGLALAVWAERMFAAAGTEIMPHSPTNKALVMKGPFRFTRNPMYSGLVFVSLGVALYFGTLPFFIVPVLLFLLVNLVFAPFEEAKMLRQFGAQYTEYCARVRRWV